MTVDPFSCCALALPDALRDDLAQRLHEAGGRLDAVARWDQLQPQLQRQRPDLLVLPLDARARRLCLRLRSVGDPLAIVLVEQHDAPADRWAALESGADEVVCAGMPAREVWARLAAVLRRAQRVWGEDHRLDQEYRIGQQAFLPATRVLVGRDGAHRLQGPVLRILFELVRQPCVPIARQRLLAIAYPTRAPRHDRAIDVAVLRLRRLIEPDAAAPRHIQTVRGVGYVFIP